MKTLKPPSARRNAISLGDEEAVSQAVSAAVLGLWDVVNNLTRLHPRVATAIASPSSARLAYSHGRSLTRRPSVWPPPSPEWAATSSPAAVPG